MSDRLGWDPTAPMEEPIGAHDYASRRLPDGTWLRVVQQFSTDTHSMHTRVDVFTAEGVRVGISIPLPRPLDWTRSAHDILSDVARGMSVHQGAADE